MSRLYLRLIIIPFLMISAALIVIQARPYDDHALREFLLPEGCPAPCFMGIRPGVTTMTEAERLLNESQWVGKITFANSTYIAWTWSGEQPTWINQTPKGTLSGADNTVTALQVGSRIRFGDMQLDMGRTGILEQWAYQTGRYATYTVSYPEHHLKLNFMVDCKNRIRYLQPVTIIFGDNLTDDNRSVGSNLQWSFFKCSA
ncbi:MAG: hypothetical protein H0X30_07895 [Anaerolineae bacterium]|nr:hypothetical protein [Anaerolineae bacterium]